MEITEIDTIVSYPIMIIVAIFIRILLSFGYVMLTSSNKSETGPSSLIVSSVCQANFALLDYNR